MTPADFVAKWERSTARERQASHEHFLDICHLIGHATPIEADPSGTWYCFDKGATKPDGHDGFADVWMRGHFAWEYKGPGEKDLTRAFGQLVKYRDALESPPLLVVSDMDRIEIHTSFTNTPSRVYAFSLADLAARPAEPLRQLRALFGDPDSLRPDLVRALVTEQAAGKFAGLARSLRERGSDAPAVAHFLDRVLFCLFAEDAGLLPKGLMARLVENLYANPAAFNAGLARLFAVMAAEGGTFGTDWIDWFDGGLFDAAPAIELRADEIRVIRDAADLDWADVEPAIFGTLFERGLDPDKRSQLGAHYTDRASIERLVEATVLVPLRREMAHMQAAVTALLGGADGADPAVLGDARRQVEALLARLRAVTVLDPPAAPGTSCTWPCACSRTWSTRSSSGPPSASGCPGRRPGSVLARCGGSRSTLMPPNSPGW